MDESRENLQATIDRIALELAHERAAHRATAERLERAEARARAWRRVARWIHEANEETHGQDR